MQSASSGIDSRNTRWCQYYMLFLDIGTNLFQEGRFTRTIFAYNTKFFVAREVVVEIIENFVVAKGFADILCLEYF